MKKKVLMTLFVLLGMLQGAWCHEYPYLTFQSADGTTKSLSVESLRMTFSDSQLFASNVDGEEVFDLSVLNKMYFSANVSMPVGDVNRDGFINVTDAVCVVNEILKPGIEDIDLVAADVNGDGIINITDAIMLINIILK